MSSNLNKPTVSPTVANDFTRRDFIKGALAAGVVVGGASAGFYFGYEKSLGKPLRVGVLGTGDEGSVLIGAVNPDFIQVVSIADVRPYNVWRAFHGDWYSDESHKVRPGLMAKYGWRNEDAARRKVKTYGAYQELIENAKADGVEAIIIALPLHLHAPAAVAAMKAGLHVLTEKLMAHTVHECKEMARVADMTGRCLAVGHQRHYNLLYANAMDMIRRGTFGDIHYVRAQWHRGNLPGSDSWQQPLPRSAKPDDRLADSLEKKLKAWEFEAAVATGRDANLWRRRVEQVKAQISDKDVDAAKFGYSPYAIKDASGNEIYKASAIEELIRWRLWDRTSAGLMAELGSHQLDAASLFVAAAHGGEKQIPLSVQAMGARPLFPPDRDVEDHVYCLIDFPAPGYDPKDPQAEKRKIGVQYASINGNGFGGYGEVVFGTKGTFIIDREKELSTFYSGPAKVSVSTSQNAALDTQASGPAAKAAAVATADVSRGYREEIEHWAWCARHPDPHNKPRCYPKAAMGDAIVALVANMSAHEGKRIEFKKSWFDVESDDTPENVKPDVSRYA